MQLHGLARVVSELEKGSRLDDSMSRSARHALRLVEALSGADCPEKWIEYGGHNTILIYHAAASSVPTGSRRLVQVRVDSPFGAPSQAFVNYPVAFLLPHELRPWRYATADASGLESAVAMVLDGLEQCEQGAAHLLLEDPQ